MPKRTFTLKDCDKIIDDILDEYFEQHNIDYDLKELMKTTMRSEGEVVEQPEQVAEL